MSDASVKKKYQRIPYLIVFKEQATFKDTYGGAEGAVALEAHLLKPDTPGCRFRRPWPSRASTSSIATAAIGASTTP
jgi:hypothetical protein